MPNGYSGEDVEALLESLESDGSGEMEAVWSRPGSFRRPAPRTAPGTGSYRAPTPNTYVTQKELQENIQRVDAKIKTNSDAIAAVNTRVNTLSADVSRQTTALKKEVEERKKDVAGLRSNVQLAALLPLLTPQKTKDVTDSVANTSLVKGDKILVDGASSLSALLPLLLLGGMGGSSDGSSSSSAGGMNDPMMLLVLVLALSQR